MAASVILGLGCLRQRRRTNKISKSTLSFSGNHGRPSRGHHEHEIRRRKRLIGDECPSRFLFGETLGARSLIFCDYRKRRRDPGDFRKMLRASLRRSAAFQRAGTPIVMVDLPVGLAHLVTDPIEPLAGHSSVDPGARWPSWARVMPMMRSPAGARQKR
jgi:hypothetical protein